jgi:hypothetical protein
MAILLCDPEYRSRGQDWKDGFTERILKDDGFVGIGEVNPDTKLHVNGAITVTDQSAPATVDNGNCAIF